MRVASSSTISGAIGELGASTPSPQSSETDTTAEFAQEMASAGKAEADPNGADANPTVLKQAQPKLETVPGSVLPVVGGLITLAPTKPDGDRASVEAAAPLPVSAFNLTTTTESSAVAIECRAAVDGALRERGLDPAQFKMSFWEEAVSYPGGGYMNRCITVETPEGYRMDFDAALTLQSPHVTAEGIRMLRSGQWSTTAAVVS